jgi:methionyl-tRNA formyltransferase
MKLLFAGSPEIAVPSLAAVAGSFDICAVLTNPVREAGRGKRMLNTPVHLKAKQLGIAVLQPERLDSDFRSEIAELKPDLLVVVAYGKIFGPKFLALFPMGGINLHPSLLPRHRGPSPIPAAILSGDAETGITIQRIAREMDSGAIMAQTRMAITDTDTTGQLTIKAANQGAELLMTVMQELAGGRVETCAQDEEKVTYCPLIEKGDGKIDWQSSAIHIARMVRAFDPWPTASTSYKDRSLAILKAHVYRKLEFSADASPGEVVGVDKAEGILIQTKSGILAVEELQLQSRKALGWKAFINGAADFVGSMLGGE